MWTDRRTEGRTDRVITIGHPHFMRGPKKGKRSRGEVREENICSEERRGRREERR